MNCLLDISFQDDTYMLGLYITTLRIFSDVDELVDWSSLVILIQGVYFYLILGIKLYADLEDEVGQPLDILGIFKM